MPAFSEDEILAALTQIETGEVRLTPKKFPQQVHSGAVEYAASNGFTLTLFVLGNAWDYLERLEAPDGRAITRSEMEKMPRLAIYEPPAELAWSRYGTPGWCTFRCVRCGSEVVRFSEFVPVPDGAFVCATCAA